jgi:hypothetical protein
VGENSGAAQYRLSTAKKEKQNKESYEGVDEQSRDISKSAGRHAKERDDSFLRLVHGRCLHV